MDELRFMISEASKRVEVESHVLRYWEEELELPIERNELGHRYYKEADINLLKKVRDLKEEGFQLKAIKMLLPNIHKMDKLDHISTCRLKDKLNKQVLEMSGDEPVDEGKEVEELEEGTSLVNSDTNSIQEVNNDKMLQFRALMNDIISNALRDNNHILSDDISNNVTESVSREMNYLMRLQEEKDEERYRNFDATLREYQNSRMLAAAGKTPRRKKSKYFKKNNVYI